MSSSPSPRAAPPRLALRFAVYAGVALALAGAASIWVGKGLATQRAEQEVHEAARFVAERLAADDLARSALDGPATGDVRAQLDDLFGREALGPEAHRISVIDREGRITYSTDHALIGVRAAEPEKVAAALAGKPVYGVAADGERRVLQSYVVARWLLADPTWPAGVLAVERDYAPIASEIRADVQRQAAGILAALLLLYVALFPILRRVTRTLAQRNRELSASEAQYRALTEQASDAILVTDGGGVVLEVNAQACELLQRPEHGLVGLGFAELVSPDDLAAQPLRLGELAAGRTILHERRLLRPDGTTVLGELHARMLADGRILASIRDVTERRRVEDALRRAERAEAAERLAASIAHDFDSLLVGVVGSSDVLLAHILEGDPLRRHVDAVSDAASRAGELVDQLKAFGTREVQRPQATEADPLLRGLEAELGGDPGGAVAVERPASGPAPAGSRSGAATILLVEDEEIVHAIVEEILHDQGYTVIGARDGREGLELCERHDGPIDLLLTDIVMPELGGRELADAARRLRPDLAVVFMSGYAEEVAALGDEGAPFLQKPFTHESLIRTVGDTLEGPALLAVRS